MAVLLIEIDQIHEDQAALQFVQRGERFRHAVGIALGLFVFADAAAEKNVEDFADAVDLDLSVVELIEQHAFGRGNGVIVAVGRARERARLPDKRTRDHAAHFVRAAQNITRDFADLVKLPERNHFFVRGDLEDAVGRGVDDRRAGAHVFFAQFLDDFGSGRGVIAERAAADVAFELVHDLGRKTVRVERKRFRQMNADHLPVAGGGVFPGGRQRTFSKSRRGPVHGPHMRERLQIPQSKLGEIRQVQSAGASDIAQRVAARIAISSGVRHFAGAHAVEHDPNDAAEWRH